MRTGMIAFCLAVTITTFFPRLPDWEPFAAAALACLGLGCWFGHRDRKLTARLLLLTGCFLCGLAWHVWWGAMQLQQRLPLVLEGEDMLVIGWITSLPESSDRMQQFHFYVQQSSNTFSQRKILLNYYGDSLLGTGQRWQFRVRLNRPHGFYNPGGFDYEAWLMQQGIHAKGYVRSSSLNQLLDSGRPSLQRLRFILREKLLHATANLTHGNVILALALGDRSGIDSHDWEIYTRTGTNHLVVVSGLHVGFISGLAFLLVNRLWRLSATLCLRLPAQLAGAGAAVAGSLIYSLLAGFSLPTQRAFVMVAVFMLLRFFRRTPPLSFSFLTALVFVLLLNPMSPVAAGFWLSFVAVASLLLVFSGSQFKPVAVGSNAFWINYLQPQWVVFIALLIPLSIWLHQFPLISPLANFVAIPLVSLLIVPLCLFGTLLLAFIPAAASPVLFVADALLSIMWAILSWLSQQSWLPDPVQVSHVSTYGIALAAIGTVVMLLPVRLNEKALSLLFLLPMLLPLQSSTVPQGMHLYVLDVGQGLAVIIRTAEHVMVYDSGPQFSDDFSAGAAVVAPVLQSLGIDEIDLLLVSHGDNDHAGGAAGLVSALTVRRLLSSSELPSITQAVEFCRAGEKWQWDGVEFHILHPITFYTGSDNDGSCVLQVTWGGHALLLPGDIEARAEGELVRNYGSGLKSTVLIAPHHGSNTSSTASFIAAVAPGFVVFSAGYRNQFGHPAAPVMARYARNNIEALQTTHLGMLEFSFTETDSGPDVSSFRHQRPRYWH